MLFDIHLKYGRHNNMLNENARRMHAKVMQYVKDRKNGKQKTKMQGYDKGSDELRGFDMLTVFLEG